MASRLQEQRYYYMPMFETLAVILVILWLIGLVSSYTLGGYIHILLVLAVVMVLVRVIRGSSTLK